MPKCPLHDVDVPLEHVPDHTWLGMSEEDWAVNLEIYTTQPERFLKFQCPTRGRRYVEQSRYRGGV